MKSNQAEPTSTITTTDNRNLRANCLSPCTYEYTDLLNKLVALIARKVKNANSKVIEWPAISAKFNDRINSGERSDDRTDDKT